MEARPARHLVVVAAGDVPVAGDARRGVAGMGRRASTRSSPPTAGWRAPPRSTSTVACVVGDLDSADPERRQGGGGARRPDPALARDQGRVRHRAGGPRGRPPRGDADHDPGRPRRSAPRPRARQRLAPRPRRPRRRRRACCSTTASGSSLLDAPAPEGGAVERRLPGPIGAHRVAAPVRRRRRRGHDPGSPLPAPRRAARRRPGAGPVQRPDRAGRRGRGPARAASWSSRSRSRAGGLSSEP